MKHNTLYKAVALSMGLAGVAGFAYADDQPVTGSGASVNVGPVKVTIGGFVAAEAIERNRDEQADIGSKFAPVWPNADANHLSEFRMTARQSRLSLLAQGPNIEGGKGEAYYEADFLGAGVTSNSTESNSYVPRIRQVFVDYATDDGFQVLAGQAWSLVTQNKTGIVARKENAPMTIDAQYVPGFDWLRVPQLRLTQKLDMLTAGLSLESPQAIAYGKATGAVTTLPGGSLLNNGANYTIEKMPDVVVKVAVDPGFGHYELFGLKRQFQDRVDPVVGSGSSAANVPFSGSNNTANGSGVGGSVLIPVVDKVVDFQASYLSGKGVGRYGSTQLPDYTLNADGSIATIKGTHFLMGVVAHPTSTLDLYVYDGQEKVDANYDLGASGTGTNGYGNPYNSNAGCEAASGSCTGNVSKVSQVTVGGWYKFYQGAMGYMTTGLQYSHTNYETFADNAGFAPKQSMNVWAASFRYYPFSK